MSPWRQHGDRFTFTTKASPEAVALAKRLTREWLVALDTPAREIEATTADHWPAFLEMAVGVTGAQNQKSRRAASDSEGFTGDPAPGGHPAGQGP